MHSNARGEWHCRPSLLHREPDNSRRGGDRSVSLWTQRDIEVHPTKNEQIKKKKNLYIFTVNI